MQKIKYSLCAYVRMNDYCNAKSNFTWIIESLENLWIEARKKFQLEQKAKSR
jgi:hypothetical protein